MRLALAALALVVVSPAGAGEAIPVLKLPPISAAPTTSNPSRGWWVVVGTGPGLGGAVSEMTQREYAAAIRSAVAACGYATFDKASAFFTGFPERYAFEVFAIGGYPTKDIADFVLGQIRPCMPNAYVRAMSLQSEDP